MTTVIIIASMYVKCQLHHLTEIHPIYAQLKGMQSTLYPEIN